MRALLQRVSRASVRVGGEQITAIGPGLVILLGVGHGDDEATAEALARRITELRMFEDAAGKTNCSILEISGDIIVVSQFTLYADTSKGRRPDFTHAAPADVAGRLYERVVRRLGELGVQRVGTGRFGAEMAVELVNDGPFTLWLDSEAKVPSSART